MYRTLIDATSLQNELSRSAGHWLLLDCRFDLADPAVGLQHYHQGHLPGAWFIDLERDLSAPVTLSTGRHPLPEPQRLLNKLCSLGLQQDTQVVVYDDCGGAMAARGWWLLRWLGHDAVALLDGGIQAWQARGGELTTVLPEAKLSNYRPTLRSELVIDLSALEPVLAAEQISLVDARAAARFRGEMEPIDPVAGHVPGALNRPLTDNLDQGCFKPMQQLREEWLAVLAGQASDQVVHMCGSGVTACHNLLAMEFAGLTGSRLYPGSWSEWIRDPVRPVARDV